MLMSASPSLTGIPHRVRPDTYQQDENSSHQLIDKLTYRDYPLSAR